jgi:hypothetical protein
MRVPVIITIVVLAVLLLAGFVTLFVVFAKKTLETEEFRTSVALLDENLLFACEEYRRESEFIGLEFYGVIEAEYATSDHLLVYSDSRSFQSMVDDFILNDIPEGISSRPMWFYPAIYISVVQDEAVDHTSSLARDRKTPYVDMHSGPLED